MVYALPRPPNSPAGRGGRRREWSAYDRRVPLLWRPDIDVCRWLVRTIVDYEIRISLPLDGIVQGPPVAGQPSPALTPIAGPAKLYPAGLFLAVYL